METTTQTGIEYARTIGCLFLSAFLAYGLGQSFFDSASIYTKILGAILIVSNSIIILFIGILLRKTLQRYNDLVGNIYLITRIFEAVALASVVFTLIDGVNFPKDYGYYFAMLGLGLGSIPMCWTLFRHRISPSWLALWGAVGYAVFAFGFLMELLGKEWSLYLLIPGGLWEITFALWLLIKNGKHN